MISPRTGRGTCSRRTKSSRWRANFAFRTLNQRVLSISVSIWVYQIQLRLPTRWSMTRTCSSFPAAHSVRRWKAGFERVSSRRSIATARASNASYDTRAAMNRKRERSPSSVSQSGMRPVGAVAFATALAFTLSVSSVLAQTNSTPLPTIASQDAAYGKIARAYFYDGFRESPTTATATGVHDYDTQLDDVTPKAIAAHIARSVAT